MNIEQFLKEYPEFKLTTKSDTLKIINEFEKDRVFESEYFIKLKKYVLQYAEKNSVSSYDVLKLHKILVSNDSSMYENSNPAQTYFSNLMKFMRYYKNPKYYQKCIIYLIINKPEVLFGKQDSKTRNYESFLDKEFLVPFELMDQLLYKRSQNVNRTISFMFSLTYSFVGRIISIQNFVSLYDRLQKIETSKINNIITSIRLLVNSRIKIDSTNEKEQASFFIIFPLLQDTNIALMLVKSGIRNLATQENIETLIRKIMDYWYKYNLGNDKQLEQYWNKTVDDGYKDLNNYHLFIKIYTAKGTEYIENMFRENNNKPLINFQLENKASTKVYSEKNYPNRKMVLRVRPYADHNLAFSNQYSDLNLPKNEYILNNITVQSYRHLAVAIKELAQKQKIDVLIIGGHGDPKTTTLGFDYEGIIDDKNMSDHIFDNINLCFNKDAICILDSCATGKKSLFSKPLGEIIAKRLGIKVIAPDKITSSHIELRDGQITVIYNSAKQMKFNP